MHLFGRVKLHLGTAVLFLAAALCAAPAVMAQAEHAAAPAQETEHAAKAEHGAEHSAAKGPDLPAMKHVQDSYHFHFFDVLPLKHLVLPPGVTKFMVIEVIAALLILAIYIPLARAARNGEPPRGAWNNAFESLLTFVREQIAKPCLGEHTADRYVPFLWTMFLFILFNNLLGMFPFLGSPTASIFVTGAMALIVFFAIHGGAIIEMGRNGHGGHHGHDDPGDHAHGTDHAQDHDHAEGGVHPVLFTRGLVNYAKSLWPHIDLPGPMGWVIKPLVFGLELMGVLVRNAVLAVRLFANMFAGHMVLATILFFIQMAASLAFGLWAVITVSSVFGILGLSLLELFVAFLQAYIFTFLTALFMGMAMHPQH